jgi:hypothetical protein
MTIVNEQFTLSNITNEQFKVIYKIFIFKFNIFLIIIFYFLRPIIRAFNKIILRKTFKHHPQQ